MRSRCTCEPECLPFRTCACVRPAVDSASRLVSRPCVLIGLCDCGGAVGGVGSRPKRICQGSGGGRRLTGRHWEASLGELGRRGGRGRRRERCRRLSAVRCCSHAARTATATSCLPGSTCTIWEDASVQMLLYYMMSYLCKGYKYEYS